jgi:hypothetical protein
LTFPERSSCLKGSPQLRYGDDPGLRQTTQMERLDSLLPSIVTVGDGRGFVVEGIRSDLLVVTAAHCLPFFPPCHGDSELVERTYGSLLAPLGGESAISAECLFVDPIADIAVLGSPDISSLGDVAVAASRWSIRIRRYLRSYRRTYKRFSVFWYRSYDRCGDKYCKELRRYKCESNVL